MNRFTVSATYYTEATGTATLPDGKTWDDVEDWYVRCDRLYFRLKGEGEHRFCELHSDKSNSTDWSIPKYATIYPQDEDGVADCSIELGSMKGY